MALGYKELAGVLRDAIARGEYPAGSVLPRQGDLAEGHGVNVKTVRNAVALLAAEGLVTPVRRRGTVVRAKPPMRRLGAERYAKSKWKYGTTVAFAADRELDGRPWQPGDQTQTVRHLAADEETAAALGIQVGEPVVERARLVRDTGTPTHTLTSYYRAADVDATPLADPAPGPAGPGGGFQVLTLAGLEPQRMQESFQARMPTPDERAQLELPAGEPVMVLHRTTYASGDRPVEFARGIHAASRFTWTYDFDLPD